MTVAAGTPGPAATGEILAPADISPRRRTWRAFRRNPLGMGSLGVILLLAAVAVAAPLIAEFPSGYGAAILMPPSAEHPFGTDDLGRDIFAQVVWGTRVSLVIGFAASFLAILIGVAVGVLAAYARLLNAPLSMLVDVSLALPVLPLMILVAALVGPSVETLVLVIALFAWPEVARIVRSQALAVVGLPYVDAARTIGGSHLWIMTRHLLPAVAPIIVVSVVLTASRAVLSEAGLSFLGLRPRQLVLGHDPLQRAALGRAHHRLVGDALSLARDPAPRRLGDAGLDRLQRRPKPQDARSLMRQRLPAEVYAAIQTDLRARMAEAGIDAILVDDLHDVAYLTGFFHFPNERPAAVWLSADGGLLLVPALEADHAQRQAAAAELVVYPEFPGEEDAFAILLRRASPQGRVAFSPTTAVGRVERFRALAPGAEWVMDDLVGRARLLKRPEEIALHREAARLSDAMVEAGLALVRERLASGEPLPSEAELASHVTRHGVATMYAEHEDVVVTTLLAGGLVYTGPNAAFPHGLPSATRLAPGDTFILPLGCAVGGRYAESERTFVLGEPTQEQRRFFEVAAEAQRTGTDALLAGRPCAEANRLCLDVVREAGMAEHLRHRQGHGIGLWLHEPPWIADGDETPLAPGMIVSSEPGLYVPGHGGYRISDTVLVTEAGPERLTRHPRALDACVIA